MANTAPLLSLASVLPQRENRESGGSLLVPALRLFPHGLPHGAITEIAGLRSSGRMTAMLYILAQATARGEICAVVDATDQFHPASAAAAGVKLGFIVWVRCGGNAEHAMRVTDLLVHAGGFGVVVLDLCEVRPRLLDRIPISYWYRFRRALENTPTILLVCAQSCQAKAAANHLELRVKRPCWEGIRPFRLLRGIEATARLRKPIDSLPDRLLLRTIA
jgi:RecA DNA recombination protein